MKALFKKTIITPILALAFGTLWCGTPSAVPMELALVLDGSGSISASDWNLQLTGYQDAFTSGTFYDDYIAPSPYDSLYVSVYQFSTGVTQEIGWTQISNNTDATNFGNQFAFAQARSWTDTEGAVLAATGGIVNNGINGAKLVIDISTDGNPTVCDGGTSQGYPQNGCATNSSTAPLDQAIAAADAARGDGIIINALGVGSAINSTFLDGLVGKNPSSQPQGFYLIANSFNEFGSTLQTKLGKEIKVPEPNTMFLFGPGLLGLLAIAARRRASR